MRLNKNIFMESAMKTSAGSNNTMSPYLISAYESLGRELQSMVELFEGMETEQTHVNQVCNKLREVLQPLPVMPNNPNIIQAATKQIEELKIQRGNLGYALMKIPGITNLMYRKILNAESSQDINTIMEVCLDDR